MGRFINYEILVWRQVLPDLLLSRYVFPNFATITIVDPKYYPLIEKALNFLLDPANATIPCYKSKRKYLARNPCGPVNDKNKEWRLNPLDKYLCLSAPTALYLKQQALCIFDIETFLLPILEQDQ